MMNGVAVVFLIRLSCIILFALLTAGVANADTVICAPIQGFAASAKRITNPATGNSYDLNNRGCVSVNSAADIAYFKTQGIAPSIEGSGGAGGGVVDNSTGIYTLTGEYGDGVNDDTVPMLTALAACDAGGGGTVLLGPKRYLIDSADISVPRGCRVQCYAPPMSSSTPGGLDFSAMTFVVILNPAHKISLLNSTAWDGCPVFNKNVANFSQFTPSPGGATAREYANAIAQFSGVGLQLGDGAGNNGSDTRISNTFIMGFDWCIAPGGVPTYSHTATSAVNLAVNANQSLMNRFRADNIVGDCTNGMWVGAAHDYAGMQAINFHPLLTTQNQTIAKPNSLITDISDSATTPGLIRITTASAMIPETGETAWVGITVGANSVTNRWVVTKIDTTHFDLQGSNSAVLDAGTGVTFHASSTVGQVVLNGVNEDIWKQVGGTSFVTGAGIPAGAKVQTWSPKGNAIVLNVSATSTNLNSVYTIKDQPFTPNSGRMYFDQNFRQGVAFYVTDSEGVFCWNCVDYGHDISFFAGRNAYGFQCLQCASDGGQTSTADPNSTHILVEGSPSPNNANQATNFIGGWMISKAQSLVFNQNGGGAPGSFSNVLMQQNGNLIANVQLLRGALVFGGNNFGTELNKSVYIADGLDRATIYGNNLQSTFYFQGGGTTDAVRMGINATAPNTTTFAGNFSHLGRTTIGGHTNAIGDTVSPVVLGPTCTSGTGNCATLVDGAYVDVSFNTRRMNDDSTISLPDQVQSVYVTDGANGASSVVKNLTVNLPDGTSAQPLERGQKLDIYFDNGVSNITWANHLVRGAPVNIAPHNWIKCQVAPSNADFSKGSPPTFPEKDAWLCSSETPACGVRQETGGGTAANHKTATGDDCIIVVNRTGAIATNFEIGHRPWSGQRLVIKDGKGDANTNKITIVTSATVDGQTTRILSQPFESIEYVWNGTTWNQTAGAH